jgi:hypothetical protein
MTERDKKKFESVLIQLRHKLDMDKELPLVVRVEKLETLMFFSLMNDAGEQGITPELGELARRYGYEQLLKEALKYPTEEK